MITAPISIQAATWRDLGAVRQVEQVCFGEDAWPLLDLVGVLTFPNIVRLKAVTDSGEMAGFIAGDPDAKKGCGWITTVGVLPAYRRLGIARRLLLTCEERMGLDRVRLSVRRSNTGAIALYEREGYRLVDVWPRYYTGDEDALVLEKKVYKTLS